MNMLRPNLFIGARSLTLGTGVPLTCVRFMMDMSSSVAMIPVRRVARKLFIADSPVSSMICSMTTMQPAKSSVVITELPDEDAPIDAAEPPVEDAPLAGKKRGRRAKSALPLDPTLLRRSPRANKYDGFKVNVVGASSSKSSKVKPRQRYQAPPPATPIPLLQNIAVNMCGVPVEEVTEDKLQAQVVPGDAAGLD